MVTFFRPHVSRFRHCELFFFLKTRRRFIASWGRSYYSPIFPYLLKLRFLFFLSVFFFCCSVSFSAHYHAPSLARCYLSYARCYVTSGRAESRDSSGGESAKGRLCLPACLPSFLSALGRPASRRPTGAGVNDCTRNRTSRGTTWHSFGGPPSTGVDHSPSCSSTIFICLTHHPHTLGVDINLPKIKRRTFSKNSLIHRNQKSINEIN